MPRIRGRLLPREKAPNDSAVRAGQMRLPDAIPLSSDFEAISLRISQIERRGFARRAVAQAHFADIDAVSLKLAPNLIGIEACYPETQMIHVGAVRIDRPMRPSEWSCDIDEVDERGARTQMYQSQRILPVLNRAAEHARIEIGHTSQIIHANNNVIYSNHLHGDPSFSHWRKWPSRDQKGRLVQRDWVSLVARGITRVDQTPICAFGTIEQRQQPFAMFLEGGRGREGPVSLRTFKAGQ